jgi:hypothetical protein
MGSITAQPAEEIRCERLDARRTARYSNRGLPLTNDWSEHGRNYSICPKV